MPGDRVTTADIAEILGVTQQHVTDRVVRRPGFPRPVINLTQKTRQWDRNAVESFLSGRSASRRGAPRRS